jgi:hypothetical protein
MSVLGTSSPLSQRFAEVIDAYEEFLIVKGVLDVIDSCELFLNRRGRTF